MDCNVSDLNKYGDLIRISVLCDIPNRDTCCRGIGFTIRDNTTTYVDMDGGGATQSLCCLVVFFTGHRRRWHTPVEGL